VVLVPVVDNPSNMAILQRTAFQHRGYFFIQNLLVFRAEVEAVLFYGVLDAVDILIINSSWLSRLMVYFYFA